MFCISMLFLLVGFCFNIKAEEKLVNLARLAEVTYEVSTGAYFADHNQDLYNTKLTDGILDSGGKYAVCYDFFRAPEDERYVAIDVDLEKSYELRKLVLWAKNHNKSWDITSVHFFISQDSLDFQQVGSVPKVGEELSQPASGNFKVEQEINQKARFVRIVAYTRYYINLEEIEVYGLEGEKPSIAREPEKVIKKEEPVIKEQQLVNPKNTGGEIINLARKQGVSYEVTTGSYWAEKNNDKHNTMLTDGTLNSGNKQVVCYDFYRQPDEEKYISVTMDLKKGYQLSKLVLHGLNHSPLYSVTHSIFEISNDGLDYEIVKEFTEEDNALEKIGTGTWKLEANISQKARFVRVTTWTKHWLNLEELEVFGIVN